MASGGFSRDDQVLEAIFNPENPVGGLDVSKHIQHGFYTFIAVREKIFRGLFFR